jgi:hypothetical protein
LNQIDAAWADLYLRRSATGPHEAALLQRLANRASRADADDEPFGLRFLARSDD